MDCLIQILNKIGDIRKLSPNRGVKMKAGDKPSNYARRMTEPCLKLLEFLGHPPRSLRRVGWADRLLAATKGCEQGRS